MKKILTFCFASIALLLFTSFSYSKNDNFKNSTYKFGLFVDKSKKTESNSESIDSLYNSNPTKTQIDSARKQFQKKFEHFYRVGITRSFGNFLFSLIRFSLWDLKGCL